MRPIETILVPVDFSDCSWLALEYAASLAGRLGARVHVLHAWEAPEAMLPAANESVYSGQLVVLAERFASSRLSELVQAARIKGLPIDGSFLEMGSPWRSIVNIAGERHYDLIVLGTHGRKGLSHALLGSVAEKVVRCAPCPVLTVHGRSESVVSGARRILVPIDYSEGAGSALACAARISRRLGAELDIVHVWDRPAFVPDQAFVETEGGHRRALGELVRENAEREMLAFLGARRDLFEPRESLPGHRLLSGEPASTLLGELELGKHDLVVMGTRGRTGFKHLLLGSVAEKLVRFSPVPVLTVPPVSDP